MADNNFLVGFPDIEADAILDGFSDAELGDFTDDKTATAKPKYMRHFRSEEARGEAIRSFATELQDEDREVKEAELPKDKTWIEASRALHKYVNGYDIEGDDDSIAKYGLDEMGKFNYNLGLGTLPMAMNIDEATDEEKMALFYMMETYDAKDTTLAGVGRFFEGVISDPTTYMFGSGLMAKSVGGSMSKEGFKASLKAKISSIVSNNTVKGATAGAVYTGADDALRQNVGVAAEYQDEYDPFRGAMAMTIGATAGAALVNAIPITKALAGGAKKMVQEKLDTPMGDMLTGTMRAVPEEKVPTFESSLITKDNKANMRTDGGDTGVVARERFDIAKMEKISRGGSDREVFDLGDGKALKTAKTARGLSQNEAEADGYLAGTILPNVFESGKNYNVVEKVDFKAKRKEINALTNFLSSENVYTRNGQDPAKIYNLLSEAQEKFNIEGLEDLGNYDLLWGDITAPRNWGVGQDGRIVHADGGSVNANILKVTEWDKQEWDTIKATIKKIKKERGDVDKYIASLTGGVTLSELSKSDAIKLLDTGYNDDNKEEIQKKKGSK